MKKRKILECLLDFLFALGLCAITGGAFLVAQPLGWITAGVSLITGAVLAYKEVYNDAD